MNGLVPWVAAPCVAHSLSILFHRSCVPGPTAIRGSVIRARNIGPRCFGPCSCPSLGKTLHAREEDTKMARNRPGAIIELYISHSRSVPVSDLPDSLCIPGFALLKRADLRSWIDPFPGGLKYPPTSRSSLPVPVRLHLTSPSECLCIITHPPLSVPSPISLPLQTTLSATLDTPRPYQLRLLYSIATLLLCFILSSPLSPAPQPPPMPHTFAPAAYDQPYFSAAAFDAQTAFKQQSPLRDPTAAFPECVLQFSLIYLSLTLPSDVPPPSAPPSPTPPRASPSPAARATPRSTRPP
ncbi:hypothetical protein CALVIDRAFT_40260 [Calocera viscosa TUFC12733]|uniref:Uncharacterized protein n=1 Tax=Calocera viscosa (strain TUFC12733) TaxID=1330018 RepID=A0A167P1S8_CALVF|nr:hypothetical protein CALVIDRAFT_40260 [Calocera viscosa TUFC12733]